ncbi:TonB-dependent receptor [Rhodomicrobium sp.]|uniref:TonB-dependent receptor n=1 Tax=Rhodomicrobium sp. TaxID=2720632 RepID=UPI0039E3211C
MKNHLDKIVRTNLVVAAIAVTSLESPALAQTNNGASDTVVSATIQDVVVTVERRETKAQTTPGSISVIDSDQLKEENINTLRDAKGLIPNSNNPGTFLTNSTQSFWFRGIGQNDPYQDPAVGFYVDDVVMPRLIGTLGDLGDAERVEVLVGPQGTLYGRNTNAGAIKVTTRTPGDTTEGYYDVGIGNWGQLVSHGYVGGALVPGRAYASLSFAHASHDGFIYNEYLNRSVNDQDVTSLRGKFRLTPTNDLDIVLSVDGGRDNSPSFYRVPINRPGGYDPGIIASELEPTGRIDTGGVSLNVSKGLGDGLTLKSITATRSFVETPAVYDSDGLPTSISEGSNRLVERYYSQEFQLSGDYDKFNFVSGLFLFHERYDQDRLVFHSKIWGSSRLTTDSAALFGQGTYKFTDRFSGTIGLRFTGEKRDVFYEAGATDSDHQPINQFFAITADQTWYSVSPKFGIDYKWTSDIFQYASITNGSKSGGYDRSLLSAIAASTPFAPEKVTTYETGLKTSWLDRRVTANLAVFYNDYRDLQLSVWNAPANAFFAGNAQSAHSSGVELVVAALPLEGLELKGSAGYLVGTYDEAAGVLGPGTNAKGNTLMNAPRWTFTSTADYTVPLDIPGAFKLHGAIKYQTQSYSDLANTKEIIIPSFGIVDLGTSYTTEDKHWTISALAKNIFDQRPSQFGIYNSSLYVASPYPPMTALLKLSYRY